MQAVLGNILTTLSYMDGDDLEQTAMNEGAGFEDAQIETFEEAGVITSNAGLVVRLADGSEFQITIVKSR